MVSDAYILGFDTSAAHCAAALLCGPRVVAMRSEQMTRGQAERLMPLLQEVLAEAGITWRDLGRIGVGVGPGNFTGIRIGVSAARGLALALEIPAIGVSGFDAISLGAQMPHVAAIPAPRDQMYVQAPDGTQSLVEAADAAAMGVPLRYLPQPRELACRIARLAAGAAPGTAPVPLYLRAADAAPARDAPPVMLDERG
ncbi:tRNA (adenosine(37)-N6)-threonylcarbamoyltransferase complex dimerization subunit type 1 TsaB [Pelagivirga sediminicola]|uniref:tRNA (Adenosine(37)-N6)-threonylcarbamoyltransferase complex dimerization subunit type 1 TsaB n=1 Tax=Pelagivirga sediminicola TaxID=2170575 RepID=A0A2T7G4I5_9RHOB|nr:tRNA (adenosine(37)-N6)-threonylcarbamoyltransferase complex dimerization subunit type 1 TsaB [Pelagivirga sediminicola]PVA09338.1 tRNA (adenosine(37)-N6)-threonylcarbamoyltransferase complex dimerization subunit type 1 TsaB [Pelagivirga sediminicola]